jgi:hypothetical protein
MLFATNSANRLERVALRQRDDPHGVPVVADPQLAAVAADGFRGHVGF